MISMDFPITNCLLIFFQTDRRFYQIILSDTLDRGPSKSPFNKMLNVIKEKKIFLIERAKVYYCFDSEGDNFNVYKL